MNIFLKKKHTQHAKASIKDILCECIASYKIANNFVNKKGASQLRQVVANMETCMSLVKLKFNVDDGTGGWRIAV